MSALTIRADALVVGDVLEVSTRRGVRLERVSVTQYVPASWPMGAVVDVQVVGGTSSVDYAADALVTVIR